MPHLTISATPRRTTDTTPTFSRVFLIVHAPVGVGDEVGLGLDRPHVQVGQLAVVLRAQKAVALRRNKRREKNQISAGEKVPN